MKEKHFLLLSEVKKKNIFSFFHPTSDFPASFFFFFCCLSRDDEKGGNATYKSKSCFSSISNKIYGVFCCFQKIYNKVQQRCGFKTGNQIIIFFQLLLQNKISYQQTLLLVSFEVGFDRLADVRKLFLELLVKKS